MRIRLVFTIIVAKLIIKVCRLTKWGGTSLPGEIARKLYPGIIEDITGDFMTIMVTGTNGKTTTTRVISKILDENGISHITNKSGANLVDGITTTFIDSVNLFGKSPVKTALIEIDEAAFDKMVSYLQPDILVVTNFFRDQLDRFGELYTTLRKVKAGIARSPKAKLVLNADDSLCASIGNDTANRAVYFGISSEAYANTEPATNSDAVYCLYCKTRYDYSHRIYGHLGGFSCPGCGYKRPAPTIICTGVEKLDSSSSEIRYSDGQEEYQARVNLPGLYNIYNALAAAACAQLMGLPPQKTIAALGSFDCGFGRMETIDAGGKTIKVILVKNPAGFDQVLDFLLTESKEFRAAFLINDRIADGTDISWLWDVEFEKLQKCRDRLSAAYVSGDRAEDMAVRLKYAEIPADRLIIEKDYKTLLDSALSDTPEGHTLYILPTYTAMLDIRKLLKKRFGLREFWK